MRTIVLTVALATVAWSQAPPRCTAPNFLDVTKFPGAGPKYPKPRLQVTCDDSMATIRSNGIPHYEFVQITPNPLVEQNYEFRLPLAPQRLPEPVPLPLLGAAGVLVNGTVFYGPNEGPIPTEENFGDPIYNSILDICGGHTALEYHHHAVVQRCFAPQVGEGARSPVLGYAFDGFPIYGPYGCLDKDCAQVVKFRSSWERIQDPNVFAWDAYQHVKKEGAEYLDACNGRVEPDGTYGYHITETWPYIVGCYAGTPVGLRRAPPPGGPSSGPGPGGRPGGGPGTRPTMAAVKYAAERLGRDLPTVIRACRMEPGSVKPFNPAAAAHTLGVTENALREALALATGNAAPRQNQAPPGQPPCYFRCGQSDGDAVGCTIGPDFRVICHRPCDNNKCG